MDHIYIACLRLYFMHYLDSFMAMEERESADSVADFEEESADDAVSVDLER